MISKLKRFSCLILIISLVSSLAGCGQKVDIDWKNQISKDKNIITEENVFDNVGKDDENSNSYTDGKKGNNSSTLKDYGEKTNGGNNFGSSEVVVRFKSPTAYGMTNTANPVFKWTKINGAKYDLKVEQYSGGKWITAFAVTDLTEATYTNKTNLEQGGIFRSFVTAKTPAGKIECIESQSGGLVFMNYLDPKNNPSNKGIDYNFQNTISEKVLNNYLDRAVTCELLADAKGTLSVEEEGRNRLREILNIGIKYVSRSYGSFNVDSGIFGQNYNLVKKLISEAHSIDPDIVFEAGIFETTSKGANTIEIPEFVFKAFSKKVEKRHFDYEKMLFSDGSGLNQFGEGLHCPDITKEETQMFYYFLACQYIDIGIEALHMGQTWLVGKEDLNYSCYDSLISKIRSYASKKARRGLVLINSHNATTPLKNSKDQFLIDFLAEPAAIYDVAGQPSHLPTEGNPQKAEIHSTTGVWVRKYSGTTPSGWYTTNLPCYAEFDNWMSVPDSNNAVSSVTGKVDTPWGMDEISWFANQPSTYRHSFMKYMYTTSKSFNESAHICFPLTRPAYIISTGKMQYYNATNSIFSKTGFNDEEALKAIFVEGK